MSDGIVRYFGEGINKKFDIVQALRDSGWGVSYSRLSEMVGKRLVDRKNVVNRAVVSGVRCDPLYGMVFVDFEGGGWLCLDHAIEQFELERVGGV